MGHLEIRVLGGLQLRYDDRFLTNFISNKVPALLVYLAVTGRPHGRDALASLLWGDMPDADARNNLRQALSNLRKLAAPYVLITRDSVEFNTAAPHLLDCAAFLTAIQPRPRDSVAEQSERWQDAASWYRGDFLAGFWVRQAPEFEEWALRERTRFREQALQALHALTDHYLQSGAYRAAVESARHLLTLDEWREEAHSQLMLALARSGQRAAALQQYDACRRLLETELGVEPSAALTTLARRIRTALQKQRPPLPASTIPFVGRAAELELVRHRLADPTCRLLTLTGPGGMGKTHLALQAASTHRDRFLNGVCFVPLAGVHPDTPDGLLFALIDAVPLTLSGSDTPRKQLYHALAPQELLVVLDNVEHLVEQAGWLGDLLRVSPDLKILATSRERLDLSGEWVVELDGFPIPESGEPHTMDTGAGELFIANARRVKADFAVTSENAAAIRSICQLLGGLPLGISLAAVWVNTLSCSEIAAEIATTLDFLKSTHRDMPERQRSLRAVFDHSWRRLSPLEQRTFAALAIFRGSFHRRAAETITGVTPALLATLVDHSLLVYRHAGRYELHPVLQRYANEQIEQAARYPLQARHAAHFAGWLCEQERELNTPREYDIFNAIRADHDTIRAYWAWALAHQQLPLLEQGLSTLRQFYSEQGRYREGMEWLEKTAATLRVIAANESEPGRSYSLLGKVLARWATFCLWGGEPLQADRLFQEALPIARHVGEPAEVGFTLLNKGYATVLSGDYAAAEAQFAESLHAYRVAEEGYGIANALSALGALSNVTGDLERARTYLEESVAMSRRLENENGLRSSLINLGNVFYLCGDSAQARRYYLEVLPLCQKIGDRSAEAVIWSNLGSLAQEQGDLDEAERLLQTGLTIFRELASWQYVIHGTTSLAGVHVARGEYEKARRALVWALQKATAEQIHHMVPLAVYEAGVWYQARWQTMEALRLFHWVADNPLSLAEQKQAAQKQLALLESEVGRTQSRGLREQAKQLTAETILESLGNDNQR